MLQADEIYGAGFTLVVEDLAAMHDIPQQNQEQINTMFQELQDVLNKYNLDISIVLTQDDAVRLQGRILFDKMFKKLDSLCKEE